MAPQQNAPVIIRRKKVISGDGHHGGAWKVAYADFVTAMMAFFMLMWLLGATTEKQRKGIADYFNPTIPVVRASGGGSGAFGGETAFSEASLTQMGTGASQNSPSEERQARGDTGVGEAAEDDPGLAQAMSQLDSGLRGIGGESMITEKLRSHIVTRLSDEGLIIELTGARAAPLFVDGAEPSDLLKDLIAVIAPMLDLVTNDVAVQAHASAVPLVSRENQTWGLTATRADRARQLLEAAGLASGRIARVSGLGHAAPALRNPMDPRNERLEVIVLRNGT